MAKRFLDQDGLVTLWGRIKSVFLRNTSSTVADGEVAVYDGSSGNIIKSSGQKLSSKVDKETGKGLSSNDYTTAEKNKLAGVATEANASDVDYKATDKKITKTVNGTTTDVVTADKITEDGGAVKKVLVFGENVPVTGNTVDIKSGIARAVKFNGVTHAVDTDGTVDLGSLDTASKVDGVSGETINRYGVCSTTAATQQKEVTIGGGTFTLETGARVTVKFSAANSHASPTLKVGTTEAKAIFINGAAPTSANKGWLTGVQDFVYDGTQWQMVNYNTNTTYAEIGADKIIDSTNTGTGLVSGRRMYRALDAYKVDADTLINTPDELKPRTVTSKSLNEWLNAKLGAIVNADANGVIDKFNEVVAFLNGVSSEETLTSLIALASDGGRAYYGTCATGSATATKVVTLTGDAPSELKAGDMLAVAFSATNTANNPTLKVGTLEKQVVYGGSTITTTIATRDYAGRADTTILYFYNGSKWVWVGWSREPDSLDTDDINNVTKID